MSDSATPWTAAHQASLCITNSWNLFKFMSIESVMPSNHLILCHPLLLPSTFPSIRVFSKEPVLHIKWPKDWSFKFSISPSNEYQDWFPLGFTGLNSLLSKGLWRVFSNAIVQKHHQFLNHSSKASGIYFFILSYFLPVSWMVKKRKNRLLLLISLLFHASGDFLSFLTFVGTRLSFQTMVMSLLMALCYQWMLWW